jgi:hypothetical protein
MVEVWASFVQATGLASPGVRLPGTSPVQAHERLCVRADGNVHCRLADEGERLCVFVGGTGRIDATGGSIALIQRILSSTTFVASECLAWGGAQAVAWDEVGATLTQLVREGVLERVTAVER